LSHGNLTSQLLSTNRSTGIKLEASPGDTNTLLMGRLDGLTLLFDESIPIKMDRLALEGKIVEFKCEWLVHRI
jgi:hypothetical protein